jgi:succinate-semialdehyde dehydrogenase / glutarate-semialdehyde dehydrogenase
LKENLAMTHQSLNPAAGKLLKKFEGLTDKEIGTKIAAAATCFETWRHKNYAERAVIVAKTGAIMQAKKARTKRSSKK